MARTDLGLSPAIHNIGLCGLTGLIFAVLTSALVLYLEGFVTTSWSVTNAAADQSRHDGLWHSCQQPDRPSTSGTEWMISVQVMTCLGLVGLIISFGLATIYMSANRASKNISLVSLSVLSFLSGVLILVSVIVYGVESRGEKVRLSWSYYVSLVSSILCLLAGVLSVVQIRRSNVRL